MIHAQIKKAFLLGDEAGKRTQMWPARMWSSLIYVVHECEFMHGEGHAKARITSRGFSQKFETECLTGTWVFVILLGWPAQKALGSFCLRWLSSATLCQTQLLTWTLRPLCLHDKHSTNSHHSWLLSLGILCILCKLNEFISIWMYKFI